jgi:hypothetical protein
MGGRFGKYGDAKRSVSISHPGGMGNTSAPVEWPSDSTPVRSKRPTGRAGQAFHPSTIVPTYGPGTLVPIYMAGGAE